MTVEVNLKGRFGNHIIQYSIARLFAENNGLKLVTPFGFQKELEATPAADGEEVKGAHVLVTDDNLDIFNQKFPPQHYKFDGYFQRSYWLADNRAKIRTFFKTAPAEFDEENIVMHIRLGDYRYAYGASRVIHPDWYKTCLMSEQFKKLYIVMDEYDEEYLKHFDLFNPVLVQSTDFITDWNFLRRFKRLISSNGSFGWTAGLLGNATKMYVFKPFVQRPEVQMTKFDFGVEIDGVFLTTPVSKGTRLVGDIYYVNMERDVERRVKFEKQMRNLGLKAKRFVAVEPKTPEGHATIGAYGCKLSHINILKEAKRRGLETVLIFEDDAIFGIEFAADFPRIVEDLSKQPWDMCFLFTGFTTKNIKRISKVLAKIEGTQCTHAYLVHARAYDKLLEAYENPEDKRDIDVINWKLGTLNIYAAWNDLVYQPQHLDMPKNSRVRPDTFVSAPRHDKQLEAELVREDQEVQRTTRYDALVPGEWNEYSATDFRMDSFSIVVDIGAGKGDYTQKMRSLYDANVFAIEPVSATLQALRERFKEDDKVHCDDRTIFGGSMASMRTFGVAGPYSGLKQSGGTQISVTAVPLKLLTSALKVWIKRAIFSVDLLHVDCDSTAEIVSCAVQDNVISLYRYLLLHYNNEHEAQVVVELLKKTHKLITQTPDKTVQKWERV